jgi:hypothetical protein
MYRSSPRGVPSRAFNRRLGRAWTWGLRLEGQKPTGRLQPSTIHETMTLQIGLTSCDEVDGEVVRWLTRAYRQNCWKSRRTQAFTSDGLRAYPAIRAYP